MSPQLSAAQLKHAAENGQKLVEAKKLEISAYESFRDFAPEPIALLLAPSLLKPTETFFTAKILRAEIELEELEMQLKGIQHMLAQQGRMIQVPGIRQN